jgi:MoaA/NifB/PqqE/SkfB family radical SAM enzyme
MMLRTAKDILTIRRNRKADRPRPLFLSINLTGRCNLRCEFCEKSKSPSAHEIGLGDMRRLIDFGVQHDCRILLSGGEPFLHRDIWEVMEYCSRVGKKVSIVTNGTLLDGISPEQFELLGDSVSVMSVSIDSADPKENDRIRGVPGSFDKAVKFIRNPPRKTRACLNCVLTADLRRAEGMIALARDLACPLNFQPIVFESNYPGVPRLAWKEKAQEQLASSSRGAEALRSLHRHAGKRGVVTNLSLIRRYFDDYCRHADTDELFSDHVLKKFMCFIPLIQVTVDEKGYLTPCALLAGRCHISEGDLYESWVRSALEHRRLWREGRRFPVCRSCACHFAENYRSSIVAFPLANWRKLLWLAGYYAGRLYHREGRKA